MKNSVTPRLLLSSGRGRWALLGALAATALVGIGGCASLVSGPEGQVKALATQRWQYLVEGDFDKAYEMATPGFRKVRNLRDYRVRKSAVPVKWLAAEVLQVECTPAEKPTKCAVAIKLTSEPMVPGAPKMAISSRIDEVWLYEDGRWSMFESL